MEEKEKRVKTQIRLEIARVVIATQDLGYETYKVGRNNFNWLVVPKELDVRSLVSRLHATICWIEDKRTHRIIDGDVRSQQRSANGIWVMGKQGWQRVLSADFTDGMEVRLGSPSVDSPILKYLTEEDRTNLLDFDDTLEQVG